MLKLHILVLIDDDYSDKMKIICIQDLGRDTKSVQSLIRKHEGFENDLVALEAQLQVILFY